MNQKELIRKLQEQELEACAEDIIGFVQDYVHIEDKDSPDVIVPFDLWPAQKQVLRDFTEHKMNLILKARQLGFSWLALSYAAWLMICKKPGASVIALSRTEEEAKEMVRRLCLIFDTMPEFVTRKKDPQGITLESTVLEVKLKFPNKAVSTFKAFPSASTGVRSFTANLVIFDEWAFQQGAETIWAGTFPVINRPTGGQVIGLSTIERGTLFEELWLRNDKCFHKIFIPWTADPRRTEEWYEQTKAALGDMVFSEYPATPEEALMVPGGAFFPEFKEAIHICQHSSHIEDRLYGSIDYGLDGFAAFWYAVDTCGEAVVYRQLYKKDLIVPEAARALLSANAGDRVFAWFAPPDLWNRNRDTGRSTAEVFAEMGIPLVKTSNVREQGCLNIKEYLLPYEKKLDQTGNVIKTARLRIEEGCAPDLVRCLMKIQRDKNKPNEYANDPHELTHCVDSLRAFCVGRPLAAEPPSLAEEDELDMDDQIDNFVEYGR